FSLGVVMLKTTGVNLDTTRVLLGTLLIQYVGIPVIFIRFLRATDHEKFEAERQIERDRTARKFLVKVGKAESAMKIAAKVSYDLRSPIMGLQVTASFKGENIGGFGVST